VLGATPSYVTQSESPLPQKKTGICSTIQSISVLLSRGDTAAFSQAFCCGLLVEG